MTEDLIRNYEVEIVEPGCSPGSGRWGILIAVPDDISAVFPYLNTVYNNTIYDHQNKILIIRDQNQAFALRDKEIRIARVEDPLQARKTAGELIEKINRVWRDKDTITPRFTDKKRVVVIDIYKLLPKTNCRKCGYLTCLAFAADLRQGTARIDYCPPLVQAENIENRQKLEALFAP